MTKPANLASIEKATKQTWDEWLKFLESKNAKELSHREIADIVFDSLNIESAGWWSQAVTVAYEQHIGRRAAGQRSDGTYEASTSKTVDGERGEVFEKLLSKLNSLDSISEHEVVKPRTSVTPVRSYWRCELDNGDKVTVAVESRTNGKVLISVVQSNIKSESEVSTAKAYWQEFLADVQY